MEQYRREAERLSGLTETILQEQNVSPAQYTLQVTNISQYTFKVQNKSHAQYRLQVQTSDLHSTYSRYKTLDLCNTHFWYKTLDLYRTHFRYGTSALLTLPYQNCFCVATIQSHSDEVGFRSWKIGLRKITHAQAQEVL